MIFSSLEPLDQIQFDNEETRSMPKFANIDYMIENILQKFEDIHSIDEDELKSIIRRQHKLILNYDNFLSNNRNFAQQLFTSKKFLKCLLDIIGTLILDNEERICINKLCYDYLRLDTQFKDQEVLENLLAISYYVNNILVIKLSSILPVREARMLAIIANSSFKLEKNVHRINWFFTWVLPYGYNLVDLYLILFDHMMYPIIYTLLDVDTSEKSVEVKKNYDQVTASILTLLLYMTSDDIYKVLTNYGYIWILYGKPPVRFSFKNLPDTEQFSRLKKVILKIDLGPYDDIEIP